LKNLFTFIACFFISLISLSQNDTLYLKKLLKEASKITIDNPQKGDSMYHEIIKLSLRSKYPKGEYYALRELAFINYRKDNYKKAADFFTKALKNQQYISDKNNVGQTYFKLGTSYLFMGNSVKTTEAYLKTINLFQETKDTLNLIKVYDNFGVLYGNMNNYKKAEEYKIKTIALAKKIKDTFLIASGSLNLGTIYANTNRLDEAYQQYMYVKTLSKSLNNDRVNHHLYKNIARYYSEKNDMNACLENALIAYTYLKDSKNKPEKAYFQAFLGTIYQELKQFNKAEKYLLSSLKLSEEIESESLQLNSLNPLSEIFASKRDFKNAYKYARQYYTLNEKTRSEKNNKIVSDLDVKYQTEKKDKEITAQQLELKEQEADIQKKKTQSNYMLGAIAFLVVAAILLAFLFKQRQKQKNQELLTLKREVQIKTLESLIEGEEKERFRIAKELHDGVNGDLSVIKYKLSSLLEMNNKVIKEAITMIDDSCKQVRAISHNLVPPALENFDLVEATNDYCTNLNDVNPVIEIAFQHLGDSVSITKKAEVNAFRVIQELVTNSIKHAEAKNINVQISCRGNTIQITVEDNGTGFNKNEITSDGIGLDNVQSRLDYLNATLDFVSNNKGTSYTIDIDKEQVNDN